MENTSVVRLWKALPDPQRRQVKRSLLSPAFNQREELIRLLDFIDQQVSGPASAVKGRERKMAAAFSKEMAFQAIFHRSKTPNAPAAAPFDDGKMRHLLTYLLEVIRECLAWQEWRTDSAEVNLHFCRALKKLGLDEFHEKELERARQALDR
ncbi:MAG: hypothetical protein ABIO24_09840, partial [Saprospiraceae bacterium]